MKKELSAKERVALFGLLLGQTPEERQPMISKSGLTRREWEALPHLVEIIDRKGQRVQSGEKRAPLFIRSSDEAWGWASEHLAGPMTSSPRRKKSPAAAPPKKAKATVRSVNAGRVLEDLLTHLAGYFEERGETLATFLQRAPSARTAEASEPSSALAARVRGVLLELAGGSQKRVHLKDLRAALSEVSREQLDRALLDLQSAQQLTLYRLDNAVELTPADQEAALFVAGNPRHIVYLEV